MLYTIETKNNIINIDISRVSFIVADIERSQIAIGMGEKAVEVTMDSIGQLNSVRHKLAEAWEEHHKARFINVMDKPKQLTYEEITGKKEKP